MFWITYQVCLLQIFFPVYDLISHSLDFVFHRAKVLNFNEVQFISGFFNESCLCVISEKSSLYLSSCRFSPVSSSRN